MDLHRTTPYSGSHSPGELSTLAARVSRQIRLNSPNRFSRKNSAIVPQSYHTRTPRKPQWAGCCRATRTDHRSSRRSRPAPAPAPAAAPSPPVALRPAQHAHPLPPPRASQLLLQSLAQSAAAPTYPSGFTPPGSTAPAPGRLGPVPAPVRIPHSTTQSTRPTAATLIGQAHSSPLAIGALAGRTSGSWQEYKRHTTALTMTPQT
jgi:hypothetical protein